MRKTWVRQILSLPILLGFFLLLLPFFPVLPQNPNRVYASSVSALQFGNSSYAFAPDSSSLQVPADLTIEAWAKWNSGDMGQEWNILLSKLDAYTLQVYRDAEHSAYRVVGSIYVSGARRFVGGGVTRDLEDGNWHHFAFTVNKSETRGHIWVDGSEASVWVNDSTEGITDAGGNFYLGYGVTENYMMGYIDEVRISNIVRYKTNFNPQTTGFNPDQSTKALWHLDEESGGIATDSSDNNTLTLSLSPNNPTWVEGYIQPATPIPSPSPTPTPTVFALSFTNASFLSAPTSPSLEIPADLTIEGWAKWNNGDLVSNNGWNVLVNKAGAYNLAVYRNVQNSAYTVLGSVYVQGVEKISAGGIPNVNLEDGNWHHFAFTANKTTGEGRLYIDGILSPNSYINDNLSGTTDTGGDIYVGRHSNVGAYTNGYIDEVRISNTVRYSGNFTPQTTGFNPDQHTRTLWHLDEGSGGITVDLSGNNNTLTLSPSPNNPTWVEGYIQSPIPIDTTPPSIVINSPSGTVSANGVPINIGITDNESGVDSYHYFLDGNEISNTSTSIDMTYRTAGDHTFSVTATDGVGNTTSASSTFTYSPTSTSLEGAVNQMYTDGQIIRLGNSIYDKLHQGQLYITAGNYVLARETLNALINQIEAQIDIHITAEAGYLLIADINYLLSTFPQ